MLEFLQIAGIVLTAALLSSALLAKLLIVFARVTSPAHGMNSVETVTQQPLERKFDKQQSKAGDPLVGGNPPQPPHFDSEVDEPFEGESFTSAEHDTIDPSVQQTLFAETDAASGFGPMASSDYGNDLDVPTVIRNLSD